MESAGRRRNEAMFPLHECSRTHDPWTSCSGQLGLDCALPMPRPSKICSTHFSFISGDEGQTAIGKRQQKECHKLRQRKRLLAHHEGSARTRLARPTFGTCDDWHAMEKRIPAAVVQLKNMKDLHGLALCWCVPQNLHSENER